MITPEDGTYKIKFEGDDFANLFKSYALLQLRKSSLVNNNL